MTIEVKKGDLLKSVNRGFIIHGTNSVGVMQSGIANSVKEMYPSAYDVYKQDSRLLGSVSTARVTTDLVVINAVTQQYYLNHPLSDNGRQVSYDAIVSCLEEINSNDYCSFIRDRTLNFPLIGAGLGKGNWNIIASIIDETITKYKKVLWVLE